MTTDVEQLEEELAALRRKFSNLQNENEELSNLLKQERNTTSSLRTEISELQSQIDNNGMNAREWTALKK